MTPREVPFAGMLLFSKVRKPQTHYVSTIGQQTLLGAEGAAESKGHKALGIHRPAVYEAKLSGKTQESKVSKTHGRDVRRPDRTAICIVFLERNHKIRTGTPTMNGTERKTRNGSETRMDRTRPDRNAKKFLAVSRHPRAPRTSRLDQSNRLSAIYLFSRVSTRLEKNTQICSS